MTTLPNAPEPSYTPSLIPKAVRGACATKTFISGSPGKHLHDLVVVVQVVPFGPLPPVDAPEGHAPDDGNSRVLPSTPRPMILCALTIDPTRGPL